MWHVFFRDMFTFVLFLHERGWGKCDVVASGLKTYYGSNTYKFSYTSIQWGRFLTCIDNLHYFQAEMFTETQVKDLNEKENVNPTATVSIENVAIGSTKKQILHSITTSKSHHVPVLHRF